MRSTRSALPTVFVLALVFGTVPAAAQLFPGPPVNVNCSANGYDFHVADLNGNGMPDAIVGFTLPSLGNPITRGIETFLDLVTVPPAPTQTFTMPSQVNDIATGDWNEDGFVDVILVLAVGTDLRILLGGPGGMLQAPAVVPGGAGTVQIESGDFNGDGNLDFILNHGWSVSVHLGDGTGGFPNIAWTSICPTPSMNICNGLGPQMQIDDLDQDGILDLVVHYPNSAQLAPSNISVHLGTGSGLLPFLVNVTVPSTAIFQSLIVRDLTGDTVPDIVYATTTGTVVLFPGTGGATFGQAITSAIPNPGPPTNLLINGIPTSGDLNGDGLADLVYRGGVVMLNAGGGTFVQHPTVTVTQPGRVAIADLNRNLKPDLVFWTGYWPYLPFPGLSLVSNSAPCTAIGYQYGLGCAGTGGFVPALSASGCASPGSLVTLSLEDALGSSLSAALVVGSAPTNVLVGSGCSILIQPIGSFVVPFPLTGLPVAGQGRGTLTFLVPPGITPGTSVAIQAAVADPASPFQWAASNGVAITFQ